MDVKWRTRDVLSQKTLEKAEEKNIVYDRWFHDQRDKECNDKRAAAFFLHQDSKPALYASSEGELLRRPTASGVVILPTKLLFPLSFPNPQGQRKEFRGWNWRDKRRPYWNMRTVAWRRGASVLCWCVVMNFRLYPPAICFVVVLAQHPQNVLKFQVV